MTTPASAPTEKRRAEKFSVPCPPWRRSWPCAWTGRWCPPIPCRSTAAWISAPPSPPQGRCVASPTTCWTWPTRGKTTQWPGMWRTPSPSWTASWPGDGCPSWRGGRGCTSTIWRSGGGSPPSSRTAGCGRSFSPAFGRRACPSCGRRWSGWTRTPPGASIPMMRSAPSGRWRSTCPQGRPSPSTTGKARPCPTAIPPSPSP